MNSARRDYFCNLIAENSSNQRKLFRPTNSLLCELSDVSFPDHIPADDLANNFGNYFVQKIGRINDLLNALQSSEHFVVGFLPCSERFFSRYSGFPLSSNTNTSKFQFDLERTDTFKRVHMNSYVLRG